MKSLIRSMTTAAAMSMALGLFAPAAAQADSAAGYGDGYSSGAYGRVRAAEGSATILRADGESGLSDSATANAPLFPGDTLRTDGGQRLEIQLAGGSIVRIDRSSEVVFQSLPNPDAKYRDNTVLVLDAGTMSITSRLSEKDEFRIDTRGSSVYLLGEGEFRIQADDRGVTQVAARRGVAEVVGNDTSVLVRGGMLTAAVAGSAPDAPHAYSAFASDGFDRWCATRDDAYRVQDRNAVRTDETIVVPDAVRPYQAELSINGSWTVDPDYGSVWYPIGVPSGWRPYTNGYWSYGPGGYFWVSYEPWGWAPYHYGNWQWTRYHGWCWVPGPVFAGAWVSWSWGSLYVGWAPLDYWGRPGWAGGPYYGGYYDPACWTFVGYGNIHARNVNRYAVPIGTVRDDLRHATVVSRAPSVDPRRIAESPKWRERALRQVMDDHAAHLNPIQADRRPERSMPDVQDELMRRPTPKAPAAPVARSARSFRASPTIDPLVVAPRTRRILDDPRVGSPRTVRPETRDDVRDLYQRMSRPRETRGQDTLVPRSIAPSYRVPPAQAPRMVGPRVEAPEAKAPQAQAPQARAPQARAPQVRVPQAQAPPARPQRQQAAPQAKPRNADKH